MFTLRFSTFLLVCICFVAPVQAKEQSASELNALINNFVKQNMAQLGRQMGVVINLSGRQRMLTQKMSKEMLLVYLDVDAKKNRVSLGKSALLFHSTLNGLIKGDKSKKLSKTTDTDILKQMNKVSVLWQKFSKNVLSVLKTDAEKVRILSVAKENLPLLKEMNKAVYMYEKAAGADLAEMAPVVNLSGRQRMLTQKMSKEFLLIAAEISVDENKENLTKTIALFDLTLKGLRDGDPDQRLPGTPQPKILAQLDIIEKLWKEFRPVLEKQDYSMDQIKRVATLNLPLLKEMNKAVKMYELVTDA